jgi:HK97 family phage major capsid protein
MRTGLFPRDVSAAAVAAYTAAVADFPNCPTDETIELYAADWGDLAAYRHGLRAVRSELVERGDGMTAGDRDVLTVTSRLLQAVNSEMDTRTELGSRDPRPTDSRRQTAPSASDSSRRPLAVAGDMTAGRTAAAGIGTARVLAMFDAGTRSDFPDFGAFARAVATRDPRLHASASGMQTGVGADGGFAVPPGFLRSLMQASLEQEAVRPRCLVVPMPVGTVTLPRFNTADRSAGIAGLTGRPTAEGATGTAQKAKLTQLTLKAVKLSVLTPSTQELMDDGGPAFGQLLADHMAQAMAATVDDYLLLGDGVAQPLGIVNAPCTVEVAKESGQAAATVEVQNIAKMAARLAPGSFARAVWLAHSSVVAALFLLHQKVANAAANDYVGGFAPGWFSTASDGTMQLLSRPLIVTDRLQPLGTSGDLLLADLSQFVVGQVGEARLAIDSSVGFKESEVWFRLNLRLDGQPVLTSPITPRRGSDTLSPFVRLATRA